MTINMRLYKIVFCFLLVLWFAPTIAWSDHGRDPRTGKTLPHPSKGDYPPPGAITPVPYTKHGIPESQSRNLVAPPKISSACHKDLIYQTMDDMDRVITDLHNVVSRSLSNELSALRLELEDKKKQLRFCSLGVGPATLRELKRFKKERKEKQECKESLWHIMLGGICPLARPGDTLSCTGREFNILRNSTLEYLQAMYDKLDTEMFKTITDLDKSFTQTYNDCEEVAKGKQRGERIRRFERSNTDKQPGF